jgi:N,N-dimethylformamidase
MTGGVTSQACIWPTCPNLENSRGIVVRRAGDRGYSLCVESGALTLKIGDQSSSTEVGLVAKRWHFIAAIYDAASGDTAVQSRLLELGGQGKDASGSVQEDVGATELALLIAAGGLLDVGRPAPTDCFRGKIEHPRVFNRFLTAAELNALADDSDPGAMGGLVDTGPGALSGSIVNYPMRGPVGYRLDPEAEVDRVFELLRDTVTWL